MGKKKKKRGDPAVTSVACFSKELGPRDLTCTFHLMGF